MDRRRCAVILLTYASGYTHRLCLELPQPTANTLQHVLRELARHPVDVFAEATVPAAESMVQGIARPHGKWTAWTDETLYLQWIMR